MFKMKLKVGGGCCSPSALNPFHGYKFPYLMLLMFGRCFVVLGAGGCAVQTVIRGSAHMT